MAEFRFIWPDNSSYLTAGALELSRRGHGVKVYVQDEHPGVDERSLARGLDLVLLSAEPVDMPLGAVVVICGWHIARFRAIRRAASSRGPTVLFFDTQWLGTLRQWARLPLARRILPQGYDYCWVPGQRQEAFARRIGFKSDQTLRTALTFDDDAFSAVPALTTDSVGRRNFLFAGRDVPAKGLDILLEAYRQYRRDEVDPFGLIVAGGARDWLDEPGVERLGFVTPDALAGAMARSSAFVLPSRFEPFGVVLMEAAAAGLPLVATEACGAGPEVVHHGSNGWIVPTEDVGQLARRLTEIAHLDPDTLQAMGLRSREVVSRRRPNVWADEIERAVSRRQS